MKNKKGLANQIILLMVMAVVLILIMGLVFIWQLIGPPLQNTLQSSNTILQDTMSSTQDQKLINASQASFGNAAASLNNLEWFSYTMFIMMFLVFLIMCFYVRVYPFLIFIWLILVVLLFITSLYFAVTYQDLRADATLGSYYQSWENTDFMLKNLPAIVLIVGIVGGIIMFMIANRSPEVELSNYGGVPI